MLLNKNNQGYGFCRSPFHISRQVRNLEIEVRNFADNSQNRGAANNYNFITDFVKMLNNPWFSGEKAQFLVDLGKYNTRLFLFCTKELEIYVDYIINNIFLLVIYVGLWYHIWYLKIGLVIGWIIWLGGRKTSKPCFFLYMHKILFVVLYI